MTKRWISVTGEGEATVESADVPTEVAAAELTVRRSVRAWFGIDP